MNFLDRFAQNLKYQVSSISVQWKPSCSMRADGQTDMTKVTVAFRKFAKASIKKKKKGKANKRTLFYMTISTGLHSAQQSHAFKLAVS